MMNENFEKIVEVLNIEDARNEDIKNILTIQSQKIIVPENEIGNKEIENSGFLVYPISHQELKEIVGQKEKHIVKIAKESEEVVGYIISYDMQEWESLHPDWGARFDSQKEYKDLLKNKKVLYGRHIAVDKNNASFGVGKEVLDSTLGEATKQNYEYFLVEVLKKPIINNKSVKFVQKMGFELIGESHDENNRTWAVYLKHL